MSFLVHLNWLILAPVVGIIGYLLFQFIAQYLRPAKKLQLELIKIADGLLKYKKENIQILEISNLNPIFSEEPFKHLWAEYEDTLHLVRTPDGEPISMRATSTSEVYFSKESVVDTQIEADFYRHLPGILTGIGIVGTFSGLVWGLHLFDADSPETLGLLLQEVTSAFIGSGLAIFAAIGITYFEKTTLNKCYRLLETVNNRIDDLFSKGVGEEYLYRLVSASEKSSANTASLKDALIDDLKQLMHEVADKQINAQLQSAQNFSSQVSGAIKESLDAPMKDLMDVVARASGEQGGAVTGMLENLLSAFMAKIDETFGSQIQNINTAIQKSSDSMTMVQEAMTRLITDISGAGQKATSEMSAKMEESMSKAALAQEQMNQQLRSFVEELRNLILEQQNQTKQAMDETMQNILSELEKSISVISAERENQAIADKARADRLVEETEGLYSGLTDNVVQLMTDVKNAAFKTEENIRAIQNAATGAISGMNDGALVMRDAADRFSKAGDSIGGVFDKSRVVTDQLEQTASTLQMASSSVRTAFEKYDESRESVQGYVLQLQTLVENAKKEAGLSTQMLSDLERILGSLQAAEKQSTDYLNQVNSVLKGSFQQFGQEMVAQVEALKVSSDTLLTGSLSALEGAVQSMLMSVAKLKKSE
ncbi:anti-phage defense ZorAB system ZorA [Polynucleobacter sp. MWH-P3-07-1]|uniref:anti-phage ZorAB system protein ZorA n=1 Tax=Polynucleobacter sp. MWH-P3-07-1 TaxID=1743173 RepID=UPI001BFE25A7|nr:anti-phage ZorAB system protein ZorA [Polynucleobacter sp. MWH-P3-07-1]QWD83158.1 anti-phage defense ZorAB system ZorA [Polynucleobacter sp. MWH-P3-07-1]